MQNYFETDYVIIGYDKENHCLILKWIVSPTSTEFREGLNALTSAMEYFATGKVVVDTNHLGAIHPVDQAWSASEWVQGAFRAGYSHIAIIIPSYLYAQLSVKDTMSKVKDFFPSAYFNNVEAAISWIKHA